MKTLFFALLGLAVGCDKFEIEDSGSADGGSTTPGDGSERPTENGLPDWSWDLDQTGCEIQQATGVAGPGATTYFYGMFTRSGGDFRGYEEWHVFANDTWENNGGYDCIIKWTVTAVEGEAGPCTACDLNLDVLFSIDESQSTCPDDLVEDAGASTSARYDILRTEDGNSSWFFGTSGQEFGNGNWNSDAMNFITPKSCSWF